MNVRRVLVTGASGFLGTALVQALSKVEGVTLTAASRSYQTTAKDNLNYASINFSLDDNFDSILEKIDVIIHCAARVHMMKDAALDPLSEFRKVNRDITLCLARRAAALGVKRFIFISSIKVNGEVSLPNKPFRAEDHPLPTDPYAVSKMEAENGLREIANETNMEFVIIRPVLVYGPGVKANFFNMMRWLNRGFPLPFGLINNKRSLIALDNLVDLITTCIDHPAAANQIFLASDGEDLSSAELLKRMGAALGKPVYLIPIPVHMIKLIASLIGKQDVVNRILDSLVVDISKTRQLLKWTPPLGITQALEKTAENFLDNYK